MRQLAVVFALFASVCSAEPVTVTSSCQYRETGADEGASPVEAGTHRVTSIELQSIRPAEGGRIGVTTELEVDVEYQVENFVPNQFYLIARFPTTFGTMSVGGRENTPLLRSARGRALLCVPLAEVFDDPDVRWPLTVVISINQIQAGGASRPVADTRTVVFSPFDVPEGGDPRRAAAPPEQYVRALMKAFSFFESPRALDTVCATRFPEMQDAFARAYPTWQARHGDTINLINTLQFEQFKLAGKN